MKFLKDVLVMYVVRAIYPKPWDPINSIILKKPASRGTHYWAG